MTTSREARDAAPFEKLRRGSSAESFSSDAIRVTRASCTVSQFSQATDSSRKNRTETLSVVTRSSSAASQSSQADLSRASVPQRVSSSQGDSAVRSGSDAFMRTPSVGLRTLPLRHTSLVDPKQVLSDNTRSRPAGPRGSSKVESPLKAPQFFDRAKSLDVTLERSYCSTLT
jgi:hypothetical protein